MTIEKRQRRLATLLGLAVGDALGSTSEFEIPSNVGRLCDKYPGWPGKLVGGGKVGWRKGQPTDDTEMALAVSQSIAEKGRFDPEDVAARFVSWLKGNPADMGGTTYRTLSAIRSGKKWYEAGLREYRRDPENLANGSLMRNGVVAPFFPDRDQAIEATVLHGIITHFAPLPVLTCVIQTLLIHDAIWHRTREAPPTIAEVEEFLAGPWTHWKEHVSILPCRMWLAEVGNSLDAAERRVVDELRGFERFDPFVQDYRGRSGYCVLTIKIAMWALFWSFAEDSPEIPDWIPAWPFQRHGFDTLMWVALVGADSDTYAAVSGAMLGAIHPQIPGALLDGLESKQALEQCLGQHDATRS